MATKFKDNTNNATVWLKQKTKKVFKGENKGNDYDVFEGTIDTGGGKMITLKIYSNTMETTNEDGTFLPVRISKWKGTPKQKTVRKSNW